MFNAAWAEFEAIARKLPRSGSWACDGTSAPPHKDKNLLL